MTAKIFLPAAASVIALIGSLLLVASASAHHRDFHEAPPSGTHPSIFATQFQQCLGPLRSSIAQGDFAGVGPFGEHFTGQVNPGAHQGTVAEEEFLIALGLDPADCPFD